MLATDTGSVISIATGTGRGRYIQMIRIAAAAGHRKYLACYRTQLQCDTVVDSNSLRMVIGEVFSSTRCPTTTSSPQNIYRKICVRKQADMLRQACQASTKYQAIAKEMTTSGAATTTRLPPPEPPPPFQWNMHGNKWHYRCRINRRHRSNSSTSCRSTGAVTDI